jgi:hypothetical protein
MKLILPDRTYPDDAARRLFVTKTIDALHRIAESIERRRSAACPTARTPRARSKSKVTPAGPNNLPVVVFMRHGGYFSMLRIPIFRGRDFRRRS